MVDLKAALLTSRLIGRISGLSFVLKFLTVVCETLCPCFIHQSLICYNWDLINCADESAGIYAVSNVLNQISLLDNGTWHSFSSRILFYMLALSTPSGPWSCNGISYDSALISKRKFSTISVKRLFIMNTRRSCWVCWLKRFLIFFEDCKIRDRSLFFGRRVGGQRILGEIIEFLGRQKGD